MTVRRRCRMLAGEHDLGQLRGLYRERRFEWMRYLWKTLSVLYFIAIAVGVLGAMLGWRVVYTLLAVALCALIVTAYVAPVEGRDGRRWLAVCDGGLIVAREHGAPTVLTWSGVVMTLHLPRFFRTKVLTPAVRRETRYPEVYQIAAIEAGGAPTSIEVAAFGRQRWLVRAVERNVTPHLLERARRELADTRRATFGPVAITPHYLEVSDGSRLQRIDLQAVAWNARRGRMYRKLMLHADAQAPGVTPALRRIPINAALVTLAREVTQRPSQRRTDAPRADPPPSPGQRPTRRTRRSGPAAQLATARDLAARTTALWEVDREAAAEAGWEALRAFRRARGALSTQDRTLFAATAQRVATARLDAGSPGDAAQAANDAVEMYRICQKDDPEAFADELAMSLVVRARCRAAQGNAEAARHDISAAVTLLAQDTGPATRDRASVMRAVAEAKRALRA